MSSPEYYVGLDLGKRQDYSAVAVVHRAEAEEEEEVTPDPPPPEGFEEYQIQHLHRFEIGTPYREVATYMKRLTGQRALREGRTRVIVDRTGVGEPVYEMLRDEGLRRMHGITITGGDSVSEEGRHFRVPKRDLVSVLQVLVQNGDLVYNDRLPFADILGKEMQNFTVKIDLQTGHDSYEHWREGDHDDLVLAVALPCWFAQHGRSPEAFVACGRPDPSWVL